MGHSTHIETGKRKSEIYTHTHRGKKWTKNEQSERSNKWPHRKTSYKNPNINQLNKSLKLKCDSTE